RAEAMTTRILPAGRLRAAQALAIFLAGLGGVWRPQALAGDASPPVDFQRDVRPVLSDACFRCHGPDREARQADLPLDLREGGAFDDRDESRVIVPGRPGESELYRRITAPEPGRRMPPAKHPRRLNQEEVALLRRWIEQGAPWQVHWSFVPPRRPALPPVQCVSWPRNAIDFFVLARLEKEGLRPAPEADRATLIRRVTLDLTGLPPAPGEVDAFVADRAPDAYERVVDRLLA